jgi:seryl-tRNA synthetase
MHDLKLIRDDAEAFKLALQQRGTWNIEAIQDIDQSLRGYLQEQEKHTADLKVMSRQFGEYKQRGEMPPTDLVESIQFAKTRLAILQDNPNQNPDMLKARRDDLLASLPNLPAENVPDGADESGNEQIYERGARRNFAFTPREHFEIGPALGMDFETAQKVSGARFAYLRGDLARLSRALGQFMLDLHAGEFGYEEVAPPLLVREHAMFGTGQLPKMAEDSFQTTDGRWLIPTSEVSMTNIVSGEILAEATLPLRFTALTPCFRSEAGAAGRDTRGLIRQHQFDKVELVSITTPEASDEEHERMTQCAETVLERLGLPFRRMLLCAGDMGFSARRTFDLEVWLPGQQAWREISSCSTCGDFQARRMNARYRPAKDTGAEKGTKFVHTLNGSGVAVGRALVAVIENYQNEDGSVDVPDVLIPYMRGLSRIVPG